MGHSKEGEATYQDVLDAPPHKVAEIIDGERAEVQHAWLVSPTNRTLEVMRRQGIQWLTLAVHHDDQKVRAEPFDAIELDLAILWSDLAPATDPAERK